MAVKNSVVYIRLANPLQPYTQLSSYYSDVLLILPLYYYLPRVTTYQPTYIMKAVVETCVRADFGVKDIKITKPRIEDSEMSACFHKLKELVPSVPQHKRISKVALLQHVIDYILDLEITLEKHPAMASIPPPLASVCRSPLAEKSDLNAQIEPACDVLMEAAASAGMCDLRPPSK